MPTSLTVDHGDGTSFDAVANTSIQQEGSGPTAAVLIPGSGWVILEGQGTRGKSTHSIVVVSGSKLFVQNIPASGSQPAKTRYTLLHASPGGSYVATLDETYEQSFEQGQCVEVINTNPPSIGNAQSYSAATFPDTASALQTAEAALAEYQS